MAQYKVLNQKKSINSKQNIRNAQLRDNRVSSIVQMAKINPKMLTQNDVMLLQRTMGNGAVCQLINCASDKPKETVQKKDEKLEDNESLQMKVDVNLFQKVEIPKEKSPIQGKFEGVQKVDKEEHVQMKKENNTGLPDNLKAGVENLSGINMDNVRVHYNSDKPKQMGALAYTKGTQIHVAQGQEKHLPHEAWHVVQQAQGRVKPTIQMKQGALVNDDVVLENEADKMGIKAINANSIVCTTFMKENFLHKEKSIIQRRIPNPTDLAPLKGNNVTDSQAHEDGLRLILEREINKLIYEKKINDEECIKNFGYDFQELKRRVSAATLKELVGIAEVICEKYPELQMGDLTKYNASIKNLSEDTLSNFNKMYVKVLEMFDSIIAGKHDLYIKKQFGSDSVKIILEKCKKARTALIDFNDNGEIFMDGSGSYDEMELGGGTVFKEKMILPTQILKGDVDGLIGIFHESMHAGNKEINDYGYKDSPGFDKLPVKTKIQNAAHYEDIGEVARRKSTVELNAKETERYIYSLVKSIGDNQITSEYNKLEQDMYISKDFFKVINGFSDLILPGITFVCQGWYKSDVPKNYREVFTKLFESINTCNNNLVPISKIASKNIPSELASECTDEIDQINNISKSLTKSKQRIFEQLGQVQLLCLNKPEFSILSMINSKLKPLSDETNAIKAYLTTNNQGVEQLYEYISNKIALIDSRSVDEVKGLSDITKCIDGCLQIAKFVYANTGSGIKSYTDILNISDEILNTIIENIEAVNENNISSIKHKCLTLRGNIFNCRNAMIPQIKYNNNIPNISGSSTFSAPDANILRNVSETIRKAWSNAANIHGNLIRVYKDNKLINKFEIGEDTGIEALKYISELENLTIHKRTIPKKKLISLGSRNKDPQFITPIDISLSEGLVRSILLVSKQFRSGSDFITSDKLKNATDEKEYLIAALTYIGFITGSLNGDLKLITYLNVQ